VTSILMTPLFMYVFDDNEMYTKEPPATTLPAEYRNLIALYSVSQGLIFGGIVAIEALLGLATEHMYGLSPGDAWPFWLVLSLATPAGIIFYRTIRSKLGGDLQSSRALYVTASIGGVLCLNWMDLTQAVSPYQLWAGLLIMCAGTMGCLGMINSSAYTVLPVSAMPILTTIASVTAMLGRAVGPVLTTSTYSLMLDLSPDTVLADNVGLLMQFSYVGISIVIGLVWGNTMFETGEASKGPPAKEDEKGEPNAPAEEEPKAAPDV